MRILITGGCGFIGHHFVEHIIKNTNWEIVVWDKLTYAASGFDRLRDISVFDNKRIKIFTVDFSKPISEGVAAETGNLDYIVHMGAETHVDNSIEDPISFIKSNVLGTAYMLEFAKEHKELRRFLYFGTDEVFGPAPEGVWYKEWDRYNSGNPYAATKAGGEELCLAYANTYSLPISITHTMNAFGERQNGEKFIPLIIRNILQGKTVTVHADKKLTKAGSRHYIHCRNIAASIEFLLDKAKTGEKYNVVGEKEIDNLEMVKFIGRVLGKEPKYQLVDFHSSRPGHDLRYALDGTKMKELGWELPLDFEASLEKTILWYLKDKNRRWLGL